MSTSHPPRLRVLQCITRLGLGGAERVAFSIVRGLRREVDFGVFTVHGAGSDSLGQTMPAELRQAGVPWFQGTRVPLKQGGMVPGAFALARAVRAFRPDILHFHSETPEACGAMLHRLFPRHRGTTLVRTIHNSVFWRYWPRIGRWCDRRLATAHIACVSEAAREEFLRYRADSGAEPPPVAPVVIYNGVDVPRRPAHAVPHDAAERRILFAGRFEYQKGTDVLRAALPNVPLPPGTTSRLTLLGHGADETALRQIAATPPPGWRIEVRPPVSRLDAVLPDFDLVVMPSRFEGLGLVAIEALLCGLPIVVTAAPGLSETFPAGYPWTAHPGDATSLAEALGKALAETHRWGPAVDAAQRFAESRFSPEAMANGYLRLYQQAGDMPKSR